MSENTQVVLERADLELAITKANENLEAAIEKAQGQAKDAGTASSEAKAAIDALATKAADVTDRLIALEQRGVDMPVEQKETLGDMFVKSDSFKAMAEGRQSRANLQLKTAILNTYPESSVQPLVQGDRIMSIFSTPNRRLTLRDLLPSMPTNSNLVEFTRENALTSQLALAA